MNYKRAIGFGILLWIFIFVIISIVMFIPALKDKTNTQNIIYWVLDIPLVLIMAKWYFVSDTPSVKKGFFLGIIALLTGTVLDMVITVPLFVKSYAVFYSSWTLYCGYAFVLALCTIAGGEFDLPVFKRMKTPKPDCEACAIDKTTKV